MMFSTLNRVIFWDLIKVFFLALFALTGILLFAGIFAEATKNGLSPMQVVMIIPLLIPNFLPYTLPTTTLFATCLVYGRLAADNEVLAVKAAGINLLHLVKPAIVLGILASLVTCFLYLEVIPATQFALRTRFAADIEDLLYSMLKRDGRISHPRLGYTIHVKRVEGRILQDAIFMRRDPKNQYYDIIARAGEAELRVDMEKKQVLVEMRRCHISNENGDDNGYVEQRTWPVDLPPDFFNVKVQRPSQYPWLALKDSRDDVTKKIHGTEDEIKAHQQLIDGGAKDPNLVTHVGHLKNILHQLRREYANFDTEMHARPSLALGCLCFVLVGCPVGIWFSKSDYLSSFITSFLPIVVIYYPMLLAGINLAKGGSVSPMATLWNANLALVISSLFMFRMLLKH